MRYRDLALILPLVGMLVFLTPLVRVAGSDVSVFGLPVAIVYIYGFWVLLILLTRRLARRLGRDDSE